MPKKEKQVEGDDYKRMVDLLLTLANATTLVEVLQAELNQALLAAVQDVKESYAEYQLVITDTSAAIETIARKHPEWFLDRQSIKTPAGTVQFRTGTRLEIPNEEISLALIAEAIQRGERILDAIKVTKSLSLEFLEGLDDATLKRFRIHRVTTQTFSIKPAKVDLGKAISASEQTTTSEHLPA